MFNRGGGFKRCTSASRKMTKEQAVLYMYQTVQPMQINQYLSPNQRKLVIRQRVMRPMTAVGHDNDDSTREIEVRKQKTMKTRGQILTYRLETKKQSTHMQLETIVDSMLKKSNNTTTVIDQEQKAKTYTQIPYDLFQKQKTATRSSSTEIIEAQSNGLERYMITNTLGQGSYAIVRLARDMLTQKYLFDTSRLVAIKTYLKVRLSTSQRKQSLKREIHILKHLEHPNIISYINTIETPTEFHLVTEYGGSTSLRSYLKQFPGRRLEEDNARRIFKDLVRAVEFCHRHNIVHRDIKLENVLVSDSVKLIDFGFSVITTKESKLSVFCGTPSYMAPELVSKQEYLGKPVDVWALGVLFYSLVTGAFPFRGKDDAELYSNIKKGIYRQPQVSVQCQKVISQMLVIRPSERVTAHQLLVDKYFV